MAKITLNSALSELRGGIDNWVYRKTSNGFVVARRPAASTVAPTDAQTAIRDQFAAAAAYAKAILTDAVVGPRYVEAAKKAGLRPFAFALADYFKPPIVQTIVTAAYHGAVGDPIDVRAIDDFEVAGVTVAIKGAADAVIEHGNAALVNGVWRYAATTVIAAGTAVTIEAVATDRPGHTGAHSVPLVVG